MLLQNKKVNLVGVCASFTPSVTQYKGEGESHSDEANYFHLSSAPCQ